MKTYNLTSPQKSILYTEEYFENTSINNICGTLIINETVDFEKLANAIHIFIKNNDSFRIRLYKQNGEFLQYFSDKYEFDSSSIICLSKEDDLILLESEIVNVPFSLIENQLFKFQLFKFTDGHGGFVVNTHHIISDACTESLIASKIMTIYSSLIKNQIPDVEHYSYIDYIESEKSYLESDKFIKNKEYWESIFNKNYEVSKIPSSNHTLSGSCAAVRKSFSISEQEMKPIHLFCSKHKISVFNFFMAIYAIYIEKTTNLENFVIGTPILNRSNFVEKNTSGMFISTMPFHISVDENCSFINFAKTIASDSLSMLRHQKYPYQNILEYVRSKNPSQSNLYDVLISYQNAKTNRNNSDIDYEVRWTFNNNTSDSIQIHLSDTNDFGSLNIDYDYRLAQYSKEDILYLHDRICFIKEQLLNNEQLLISDINIVSPKENNLILNEFNNTNKSYNFSNSIIEMFENVVNKYPNNIAIKYYDFSISYEQLLIRVNKLANYLLKYNIRENSNVGIFTTRTIDTIVGILAILKINCTYVPIDPEYPISRISYMIDNSKINCILAENVSCFEQISDYDNLEKISVSYENYMNDNSSVLEHFTYNNNSNLYIVFTSGSTGNPKGVTISHKNMMNLMLFEKNETAILKDGFHNILQFATMSFDVSYQEIYSSLLFGNTLILINDADRKNMNTLSKYIFNQKIDTLFIPPAYLKLLVENKDVRELIKSSVKNVITAGEALMITDGIKDLLDCNIQIHNHYGPAETHVATTYTINKYNFSTIPPIGRPISNANIHILDTNLNLCPIGIIGQICISGDCCVGNGYWNNNELTNQKFIVNPYNNNKMYLTGDLGFFDYNGIVHYVGRADFQVKLNGFRVELQEIDETLLKHPNIKSSFTIIHEENDKKYIVTYFVRKSNVSEGELLKYLRNLLPFYMIPKRLIEMECLPINTNGKIDKSKLPSFELKDCIDEFVEPKTDIEVKLSNIWKELFNISSSIGANYNFFDIGGDSLLAIKLSSLIASNFSVTVTVSDIFTSPVLSDLANLISQKNKNEDIPILPCDKKDFYNLSSAQKRVYYASKMSGETSTLYNMPGCIILDKSLDIDKLNKCFKELIRRHDTLRTCFEIIDGDVKQKINPNVDFEVKSFFEDNKSIDELFFDFVKPFDLSKAPLLRSVLINQPDKSLLLFDMHHIISDGLSLSILTTELCKLYNDEELPEISCQYVDYVQWEAKNLNSNLLHESKEFWVNQFKDDIPVLNMPTDFIRPAIQSFEGSRVYKTIPTELFKKVNDLTKKLDVSNYMFLLAIYYVLLFKYTGQKDIVVGSPVIGREKAELLNMIGMFVNSLPLKNHIDSSMSFYDFLKVIKENCTNALNHQLYPFDELVNALNITRVPSRNPLFDTMFTYQNDGFKPIFFNGVSAKYYIPDVNISKFDLSLEVVPSNNEFNLSFEYCTKLFNMDTIENFANHYINILMCVVQNYDVKISDIEILSESEKHKILYDFNSLHMDYPRDKTIIEIFEEQVKNAPDDIAVVLNEQELTYRELNEKANKLALDLINNNVQYKSVVGVLLPRSIELVVSIIAILKCGAVYLPLYTDYPNSRINYMLQNSNTDLVITNSKFNNKIDNVSVFLFNDFRDIDCISSSYTNCSLPNDIAYIIYTSGSTGKPKGVQITNNCLNNFVCSFNKYFGNISNADSFLSSTNISFDVSIFELFIPLLCGAKLVLYHEELIKDILDYCDYIVDHKITGLYIPPNILNEVYSILKDKSNLKINKLLVGVEAISKDTLDKYFLLNPSMCIVNGYGPTETTICCAAMPYTKDLNCNIVPIGKPLYNNHIYILDDNKNLQPIGVPGELYITGDGVGAGYINNENETSKNYIKNVFDTSSKNMYKTGDIGKWNFDGTISLTGRKDNQIKISGYRVELREIDTVLMSYSNIDNSITTVLDVSGKKRLISYVISKNEISEMLILSYLGEKLPFYMVPDKIVQIDAFPITSNGKIDFKALPIPIFESTVKYTAPENKTEEELCLIWQTLFDVDRVSIYDNFFHMGGDSLLSIKLVSEIYNKLHVKVNINDIFNNPTVKSLSEHILSLSTTDSKTLICKCPKMDFYPASSAQTRTYLASNMDKNSTLYNISGGIVLDNMPNITTLEYALNSIVLRHDILRTYFEMVDGKLVQKILEHMDVNIIVKDAVSNDIEEVFNLEQDSFDLGKAPLFKVYLIKLPNKKVVLMLNVHHIIFDGSSLNIFMQELVHIYKGATLPSIPISYKDFAVWEEKQLLNDGFRDSKEFWINQFNDDIPILNMPTSFPRPANKNYEGTTFVTSISNDISTKIHNLANKYNVTPYILMLCAYYVLLYKYTGQEDIIIGTPISGRIQAELEPLIGMFVNSIPLRNTINSDLTFETFLNNVKTNFANAFAHQDYPFDVLVNDLNINRDPSRSPLFDTMFIYQNNGFPLINFEDGINARYYAPRLHTSKFDLSLEIIPNEDNLSLSIEYCTKLFDENFIKDFVKHYKNILNSIIENSNMKISDISILDEEERSKILYGLNNTNLEYSENKTIANLFEEQCVKTPNNIALVFENKQITYKELNDKSNQLARYLISRGIHTGDIVGIMLPRSLEVIICMLGVLKAGGAYIPIDPTLPSNRINYMISNSNVNILLTMNNLANEIDVNDVIDVNINNSTIYNGNSDNLNICVNPKNPSYMIYTSGSTGTPKGVLLNHMALTNLTNYLNNTVEFLKDEYSNSAIISITTISFDIFVFETLICLQRGLKVIIANESEQNTPNLLDELIVKQNAIAIQMTPSRMHLFMNNKHLMPHLKNLKYVVLAGEALPKDLLNRILELGDIKVYNGYGPSETTVFSTFTDVSDYDDITIGIPIANTRIYILDKDMNICPIGIPGEMYISGDGVGIGYCNNEEMTKERFLQDIFYPNNIMYKTGDLAKYLPNGEIHYIGRVDNQIKIRGLRIELDEIEKCILKYPNIEKCIITANTDTNNRDFIVAYLVVNDRISTNKLRMFLNTMLPKYMVPSYFIVLDELPYLNNGKINKKALPSPNITSNSTEKNSNYVAPTNKLELQITTIFQNLLSISPIGIDDNFFELGGDSLLAINIQVELLKLNLSVTYSDIFIYPTVRELAKKISSDETSTFNTIDASTFSNFNSILDNTCNLPTEIVSKKLGNVLITGVTGFLGAHVLDSFLKNENGIAYCLIRPEPGLTLENKLIKKLHFYFGEIYDKYIGNRIIIVNADITQINLGLSDAQLSNISSNISCVINCAAMVSHYGNYNVYKEVNVNGTENLINFCNKFKKRFYQISTLSVSGNSLVDQSYIKQSFEHDVIFRENNFYIEQSLDNVYVRSKFEAEKLVLQNILKGLDGYILRVGNLMNRYSDGKFQQNVDENAYISRLISLSHVGCIPDYLLNGYMEFTPIDICANAIIKLAQNSTSENRIFHLFNHKHVDTIDFINILRDFIPFEITSNEEFIDKINEMFKQKDSNRLLAGILRDFDLNQKLVYESQVKLKSEFTIQYLSKIGFEWPDIDENYLVQFLNYFCSIGYLKRKEK